MSELQKVTQDRLKVDDIESRLNFSKKLQAVTNKIHATSNIDEIMLDLSREICVLFNCDRLTLYAVSNDRNFIFSKIKTGISSNKDLVLPVSTRSIAGYVALFKRSIRIHDVYDEAELKRLAPELSFCRDVDGITGYHTKQMLAAPIIEENSGQFLGVIQLINDRADGAFSPFAEECLLELCTTLAVAFVQRMKAPAAVHSRYHALIVDAVISAPEWELAVRWARRKNLDIEDALVDEFQLDLTAVGAALSKAYKLPYQRFDADRRISHDLVKKIRRQSAEMDHWLPIEEDKRGLIVVTTAPENEKLGELIKQIFPYSTVFYRVTTRREFKQMADQFFKT